MEIIDFDFYTAPAQDFIVKVKNSRLCCSKRTDNAVWEIFDTGWNSEFRQDLSEYEALDKIIETIR